MEARKIERQTNKEKGDFQYKTVQFVDQLVDSTEKWKKCHKREYNKKGILI